MAGGAIERGRSVASRVTAILMAFSSGGSHTLTNLAAVGLLLGIHRRRAPGPV